jgi:hypothetical protein
MTPLATLDFAAQAATVGLTALTAALSVDSTRARASRNITAFFLCLAISGAGSLAIGGWADWLSQSQVRWLRCVNVPTAYLVGPLLYSYVVALTSEPRRITARDWGWHALPFFVVTAFSIANAWFALDTSPAGSAMFKFVYHAWVLQGVPYLAVAAWHLHTSRALLEQVSADEAALRLSWLRRLVTVIATIWILAGI